MNELRKKFEAIESVKVAIRDGIVFSEENNMYLGGCDSDYYWLNGAWYAFQEQQKKIDEIVECVKNNTADYELDIKIQELLK